MGSRCQKRHLRAFCSFSALRVFWISFGSTIPENDSFLCRREGLNGERTLLDVYIYYSMTIPTTGFEGFLARQFVGRVILAGRWCIDCGRFRHVLDISSGHACSCRFRCREFGLAA